MSNGPQLPYHVLRVLAYGTALLQLPHTLSHFGASPTLAQGIQFREIDDAAIHQWNTVWHNPAWTFRQGGFAWDRIRTDYQAMYPERFEIAVWAGPFMCGLGVGRPDNGNLVIRLMEGLPDKSHPLRGLIRFIVVEAGLAYAKALGKSQLRLHKPALGMLNRYQQMGFTLAQPATNPPYCWMQV